MKHARKSELGRSRIGLLDAGVVLARIDRQHRSHVPATELLEQSSRGGISLCISVVNLAEVLQHAREYSKATGLDPVALLSAFKVAIHFPDIEVARKVAALTSRTGLSLADRFAAATAEIIGGRLFTTDRALARAQAKRGFRVTYF